MTDLTLDTLVKVTDADRSSMHGGWGKWRRGQWRSVTPPLCPCRNGIHVVTIGQAPYWLGPRIGVVEVAGARLDHEDKTVVERARVIEWLDTWTTATARLFAADCAERFLTPDDDQPSWNAITVARFHAIGEATDDDLDAAAEAATWASRGAGGAIATYVATYAACAATAAADGAAAYAATYAASCADDYAAERAWQGRRLLEYLRGDR